MLVVTTDKVYANAGEGRPFGEDDPLGGGDPYSASKAAAELVARSFATSFLEPAGIAVATARAGNVIGGGDWSEDRVVPDLWRAARAGEPLRLRAPGALRPWQHVLDPLDLSALRRGARDRRGRAARANFGPAPGRHEGVPRSPTHGEGLAVGLLGAGRRGPREARTLAPIVAVADEP